MNSSDDVVSLLTPPGRGGIAVVAALGPRAAEVVDACWLPLAETTRPSRNPSAAAWPIDRIRPGRWRHGAWSEEIVAVRRGDQAFEIHTHGGAIACRQVIEQFLARGFCELSWRKWLERETGDPWLAAAQQAAIEAPTLRAYAALAANARQHLPEALRDLDAQIAARDRSAAIASLRRLARSLAAGWRLVHGWSLVIGGPANAGKSTLLNRLLGFDRCLVDPQPGTTRDVVTVDAAIDGWPVRISDTAGGRDGAADPVEREGIERAGAAVDQADLVIWVSDRSQPWPAAPPRWTPGPPRLLVHNKSDLPADPTPRPPGLLVSLLPPDVDLSPIRDAVAARLFAELSQPTARLTALWQLEAVDALIDRIERNEWHEAARLRRAAAPPTLTASRSTPAAAEPRPSAAPTSTAGGPGSTDRESPRSA